MALSVTMSTIYSEGTMERYKKLKKIKEHLVKLPGFMSYKDFDISIEIGHNELQGTPLTLKQLLLENIASEATVRRHLANLIETGLVEKNINPKDNRSVYFVLTNKAHDLFEDCFKQVNLLLKEFEQFNNG